MTTRAAVRADVEAAIWRHWPASAAGAHRAAAQILAAADRYAEHYRTIRRVLIRHEPPPARPLRHTSDTDLWPVISVLADALLDDEAGP